MPIFYQTKSKNTYNDFGKLVFVSKETEFPGDIYFLEETDYSYGNDTVLIRKETRDIDSESSGRLTYRITYNDSIETYFHFRDDNVIAYRKIHYNKDRLEVKERIIDKIIPDDIQDEKRTFFYDSENRISCMEVMDYNKNKKTKYTYVYETSGDTLIMKMYNNKEIVEMTKSITVDNYEKTVHLFNDLKDVSVDERIRVEKDSFIKIHTSYENNQIFVVDSSFYYLDKESKRIMSFYDNGIKSNSTTSIFEYDEYGNEIKETVYQNSND